MKVVRECSVYKNRVTLIGSDRQYRGCQSSVALIEEIIENGCRNKGGMEVSCNKCIGNRDSTII